MALGVILVLLFFTGGLCWDTNLIFFVKNLDYAYKPDQAFSRAFSFDGN
tara:strand:- start:753 stop:899 length:147 start_codon:yes stop_codon:yes gene_type:complete